MKDQSCDLRSPNDQVNRDAASGVPIGNERSTAAPVERIVRPTAAKRGPDWDNVDRATLPRKYLSDFPPDVQRRMLEQIAKQPPNEKGEYDFYVECLKVKFSPSESIRLYDPDHQMLKIRD